MKRLFFIFLFTLAFILYGEDYRLKKNVSVSKQIITMGDIIENAQNCSPKLRDLVIVASPNPGKTLNIGKQEILNKLKANNFFDINVIGNNVRIKREGSFVKPQFFKDYIYDYLVKKSQWGKDIKVEISGKNSIFIPKDNVKWIIRPAKGSNFVSNILFKVEAYKNQKLLVSNWINAKIIVYRLVPVSKSFIRKQEFFGDNVRWEKRLIDTSIANAVLSKEKLINKRAGKSIRPNTVILKSFLEKEFLVRRGSHATLVVKYNSIEASSKVKVLKNGVLGESVNVLNLSSKKILSGKVIGQNILEVTVR